MVKQICCRRARRPKPSAADAKTIKALTWNVASGDRKFKHRVNAKAFFAHNASGVDFILGQEAGNNDRHDGDFDKQAADNGFDLVKAHGDMRIAYNTSRWTWVSELHKVTLPGGDGRFCPTRKEHDYRGGAAFGAVFKDSSGFRVGVANLHPSHNVEWSWFKTKKRGAKAQEVLSKVEALQDKLWQEDISLLITGGDMNEMNDQGIKGIVGEGPLDEKTHAANFHDMIAALPAASKEIKLWKGEALDTVGTDGGGKLFQSDHMPVAAEWVIANK